MREKKYMNRRNLAAALAVLAAALYAVNIPISKIAMAHVPSTMMAALLYLGAGAGMAVFGGLKRLAGRRQKKELLTKKELPYTIGMVLLDIAAPILLMHGIASTNAANVSLMNNFEIVATTLIAFIVFREVISRRMAWAVFLVTLASTILSFEGKESFTFNAGSLLVLGACVCWGFENNCTRMISNKSSEEIVIIKGIFSGMGSLITAFFLGERLPAFRWAAVLLLGFISYGLSINFYIMAQKELGAAKTSAYYSAAPFLGVAFGIFFLGERPAPAFYLALLIMIVAAVLTTKDTVAFQHTHEHVHTHVHEHRHGDLIHTHEHSHRHSHLHVHGGEKEQHSHIHDRGELADHVHTHECLP